MKQNNTCGEENVNKKEEKLREKERTRGKQTLKSS